MYRTPCWNRQIPCTVVGHAQCTCCRRQNIISTVLRLALVPQRIVRIWNFIRIEYRIENSRHIEYETNIESNTDIQWLQIRLQYWTVSRWLARTRRHPVAMGTSPCWRRRHRGHTHRTLCLLSDLIIKPLLTAATLILTCFAYTRIQNKIIDIPVKNYI